jgi:hypothetical protein
MLAWQQICIPSRRNEIHGKTLAMWYDDMMSSLHEHIDETGLQAWGYPLTYTKHRVVNCPGK